MSQQQPETLTSRRCSGVQLSKYMPRRRQNAHRGQAGQAQHGQCGQGFVTTRAGTSIGGHSLTGRLQLVVEAALSISRRRRMQDALRHAAAGRARSGLGSHGVLRAQHGFTRTLSRTVDANSSLMAWTMCTPWPPTGIAFTRRFHSLAGRIVNVTSEFRGSNLSSKFCGPKTRIAGTNE